MRFIWILVILSAFIAAATAITCYDCNSLDDPRCNQYFYADGVKQTECDESAGARGCITKIFTGSKVDQNPLYIRRGCLYGFDDNTKEVCEQEDPYIPWADLIACHVCKEDLCNTNSGRKSILSKILLSLTIFLCFIFNKIL